MSCNFYEDIPEPAKNSTRYLQSYVYCTLVLALFSDFYLTSATYFNKSTSVSEGITERSFNVYSEYLHPHWHSVDAEEMKH